MTLFFIGGVCRPAYLHRETAGVGPATFRGGRAMITMLGSPRRCCDGLTRRETLRAGALSLLGGAFQLPGLFALEQDRPGDAPPGQAESRIRPYLPGCAATRCM